MQYDNKYDLEHNDCPEYENEVPQEFASDFVVETDSEYADEFTSSPDEYSVDEYGSDEQAATTDLSGLYVIDDEDVAPHPCCKDINYGDTPESGNYNSENAEDYVTDPSDEQASTSDNWCNCGDSCNCGETAQEKCQLDDYEIISDVLGSEKEIVKLYSTALCETAEENLRDIIRENFTEAAADQYKAFTFMQERGMYQTEQAPENKILQAKQQFTPLCRNGNVNET